MAYSTTAPTGNNTIDGILSGHQWFNSVSFSFPDSANEYGYSGEPDMDFFALNATQIEAANFALDGFDYPEISKGFSIAGLTNLDISYVEVDGDVRYGNFGSTSDPDDTAWAYYPYTDEMAGDVWFGPNDDEYLAPDPGNYGWHTFLHETGHAFGLKHPHEVEGSFPELDSNYDAIEYTVMSYNSYVDSTSDVYENELYGYAQTYMQLDIAALQEMYGANYSTNSGDTIYKWSPDSGSTMIDGYTAIEAGANYVVDNPTYAAEANRLFLTIWDGGGNDTYDFSDYSSDLVISLLPGDHSTLSQSQLANLGSEDGSVHYASGNIYNSLLFDDNSASLIENVIAGSGYDTIIGNTANNTIVPGSGNDVVEGGDGEDTAVFSGDLAEYAGQSLLDGGIRLTNTVTGEQDDLYDVEFFQFADQKTDQNLNPVGPNQPTDNSLINGLGGDAGFGENFLDRNDDESTTEIDITSIFEDGINFFGREFDSLWVNNNGSVTFNGPRSEFTPTVITDNNNNPEITPFFADVDTLGSATIASPGGTSTGSNLVYYDFDTVNDRFIVTWDDVGYYSSHTDLTNAFQLVLTDLGDGDFNIEFRYENIDWTTGDVSGGENGLGGTVARAGWTASTGDPDAYFELPVSGDQAGILALDETAGNTGEIGIWSFDVRSGDVVSSDLPELPDWRDGWTTGDPHLITLDGVPYDFHAAGEYVLLRATGESNFELQARMAPVEGVDDMTVNRGIGARLSNGMAVSFDAADDIPMTLDGEAREIDNFSYIAVGADHIYRANNVYTIVYAGDDGAINDGDSQVVITIQDDRVDVALHLNDELAGQLEGLLGDGDGNQGNDIAFADGTPLDRPLEYSDLYGQYRDDWRVTEVENSLFSYEGDESLDGFFLPDYPAHIVTLDDFSDEDIASATQVLLDAGLEEGSVNFDNALIDYLLTGDLSYLEPASEYDNVGSDVAPETAEIVDLEIFGDLTDNEIAGGFGNDALNGMGGDDTLNGFAGDDQITDGLGNNEASGGAGDDVVKFFSGAGEIYGGTGHDALAGGFQSDLIEGGDGNDVIAGDQTTFVGGSDVINGGTGDDFMMGGRGADLFVFSVEDGNDVIGAFGVEDINYDSESGYSVAMQGADFKSGIDKVELQGFETVNAENVSSFIIDGEDGAVFSAEGTTITFYDVEADELSEDDFLIVI